METPYGQELAGTEKALGPKQLETLHNMQEELTIGDLDGMPLPSSFSELGPRSPFLLLFIDFSLVIVIYWLATT